MPFSSVVVALPIADRRASHDFHRDVLGVEAVGEPADDGIAEPLQFPLNDGVRVMLIPRGGFGWVVGTRAVADADTSECIVSVSADDKAGVDAFADRAQRAGATIVSEPGAQPWAYSVTFTDPDGHLWSVEVQ